MRMKPPGSVFTGTITRISRHGNGVITTLEGAVNIGPVKQDSVGKEVNVMMVKPFFGLCLTMDAREDNYIDRFTSMAPTSSWRAENPPRLVEPGELKFDPDVPPPPPFGKEKPVRATVKITGLSTSRRPTRGCSKRHDC